MTRVDDKPPDLSEILGVTPFFHLVPTQDLAPLVSFSRIEPEALEPKDFLAPHSGDLLKNIESEYRAGSENVTRFVTELNARFQEYDDPALHQIKFKRPVIAGDNDECPQFPKISPIFQGLLSRDSIIEEADLVEFGTDLEFPSFAGDRLRLLDGTESSEDVLQHMRYYQEKVRQERARTNGIASKKRVRGAESTVARMTRRKISLDRTKLKDSRLAALYDFLDQIVSDDEPEMQHASGGTIGDNLAAKPVIFTNEHGLVFTTEGSRELHSRLFEIRESGSITECDAEYLQVIQALCACTINHFRGLPPKEHTRKIGSAVYASCVMLMVLNLRTSNRELRLQSHIDCVVDFLSAFVPAILASSAFDAVIDPLIECLESLSDNLGTGSADDRTLTQVEYMCVKAVYCEGKVREFEQVRASMLRILGSVFQNYPSQRSFVVHEMLSNVSKLTFSKVLPREYQLANGVQVSFFAVFFVDLIQSFNVQQSYKEISLLLTLPKSDNPLGSANVKRSQILSDIATVMDDARDVAMQVCEFFLGRMATSDAVYKAAFSGLMEDLTVMMTMPEWPGAEVAASAIVHNMMAAMSAKSETALEEPFILEIVGKVGLKFLELKMQNKSQSKSGDPESADDFDALSNEHQCILSYLREYSSKMPKKGRTLHFQLLKTIVFYSGQLRKATSASRNPTFAIISNEPNHLSQTSMRLVKILDANLTALSNGVIPKLKDSDSAVNVAKTYRSLLLATSVDRLYTDFIALITTCLESGKVKVAAKAIRMLSPLVTREPKILLHERINSSISKILSKGSALSKDAVIDLLGQFMFSSEEHLIKYHVLIGNRSGDESISVRKRVIKILKTVFDYTTDTEVKAFAASKLLKRLEDEESSIVEASRTALMAMFFEAETYSETCEVMINLCGPGSDTSHILMSFIRRQLQSAAETKGHIKQIFDIAFEKILDTPGSSETNKIESAFTFVAALVECDSHLVSQDQLTTLQPLLVEEVLDQDTMCFNALRVLRLVLPNMKALRPEYVTKTNSILLKRLTKFQVRELHEAVQIIDIFSAKSDNLPLVKAAVSSMKILSTYFRKQESKPSPADAAKQRKVLNLLGCFGTHCNLEPYKAVFGKSAVGLKDNESVVSLITRFLLFFCQPENEPATRITALKNLLCVANHHPKLYLSETILNVLDSELRSSSHVSKLEVVKGLTSFLVEEDKKLARRENIQKSSKDPDAQNQGFFVDSTDVADGVCSSVIQRYISVVLQLCLQDASDVGEASVLFLQMVTKLGFANPKLCISTIIALEASTKKRIKKIACELHGEIFSRHESLADRSYSEATKMACKYLKRIEVGGHLRTPSFLRSVYQIVNTTYSAKKKFINSIVRLFYVDLETANLASAVETRDTAVFLALNLSVLNFTSVEEIYLVLFHLNRFITGEGIDLAERISKTIASRDGHGMSMANLQLLFAFSQTALAFVRLKQTLVASYSIRPGMMDGFRPSRPEMELRSAPKLVAFVDYPVGDLDLDVKLSNPAAFGPLFTRMVSSAKMYTS